MNMSNYERINDAYRYAESSDTHQYIQRQRNQTKDKQHQRHKKNDHDYSFIDDQAMVSIDALIIFLENLYNSDQKNSPVSYKDYVHNAQPETYEGPRSYALKAYQKGAKIQKEAHNPYIGSSDERLQPQYSNEDRVRILINNLEILKLYRVDYLSIEQADNFLSSLEKSIEKAKTTLTDHS